MKHYIYLPSYFNMLCVTVCMQAVMTSLYNRTTYIVMSLQFKDILDINLLIIITKTELGSKFVFISN